MNIICLPRIMCILAAFYEALKGEEMIDESCDLEDKIFERGMLDDALVENTKLRSRIKVTEDKE